MSSNASIISRLIQPGGDLISDEEAILAGGVDDYADVNALPSSPSLGDLAFITGTNTLYVYNGSAWFNIAIANQAPTAISGNEATYALAADGTPTTVTLVSTDPEGLPLTWSSSVSGDTQVGTVTNTDNVFTITPSTNEADAGTLSITFTVTDGNNTENSTSTFTLSFGLNWAVTTQQAKITASDAEASDAFGQSVAIDGDTAIVSANVEDTGASNAGAAYIFTRSGSTWTEQQKIQALDPEASDFFGVSVAISGDTAVVGCHLKDTSRGAVYVFTRSGSTWTQQQKIQASDPEDGDRFGGSVAISGDTIIAGALYEDTGASNAGAAYIFTRSGSTWTEQQKIQALDPEASDQFGWSVAIDGDTVVVGATGEDTGASAAGAAYIFTRSGSTWTEQQKIQASDKEAFDQFGGSVAIYGDNVVVGAHPEDTGGNVAGAAYIFTRSGSTWTEQQKIQSSPVVEAASFGFAVAIDDDVVVCTSLENASTGAAYIFTRDGSTWTQQQKIEASDKASDAWFGQSVAIDGDTIIVGAKYEDTIATNAGAAYIFVAG